MRCFEHNNTSAIRTRVIISPSSDYDMKEYHLKYDSKCGKIAYAEFMRIDVNKAQVFELHHA